MAEGWIRYFLKDKVVVYSAGTHPEPVNPYSILVMREAGVDISNHTSNHVDEYKDFHFDFVFTVCDNAKEICPVYSNANKLIHHSFPDPAKAIGTKEEIIETYSNVREKIKEYFLNFNYFIM
tara:strand:+ start:10874 stop:11239 length:366 start_codon:yes stop_codon:yes gene_type:complete